MAEAQISSRKQSWSQSARAGEAALRKALPSLQRWGLKPPVAQTTASNIKILDSDFVVGDFALPPHPQSFALSFIWGVGGGVSSGAAHSRKI